MPLWPLSACQCILQRRERTNGWPYLSSCFADSELWWTLVWQDGLFSGKEIWSLSNGAGDIYSLQVTFIRVHFVSPPHYSNIFSSMEHLLCGSGIRPISASVGFIRPNQRSQEWWRTSSRSWTDWHAGNKQDSVQCELFGKNGKVGQLCALAKSKNKSLR